MNRIACTVLVALLWAPTIRAQSNAPSDASLKKATEFISARHTEDLPTQSVWSKHPELGDALLWLANNAQLVGQRHRALASLRYFSGHAYRTHLITTALDTQQPDLLVGGALLGLQGHVLDKATCKQLATLQTGTNPPVRIPAERLQTSPACASSQ